MLLQAKNVEFTLKSTIFDRPRQLTLTPDYLEFDDNDLAGSTPTRFLKEEMESLRYGIKPIRGYRFIIGWTFCIDIKSTTGRLIKLRLKSIYRVRRQLLANKYGTVRNALFQYYFHDITRQYLKLFQDDQPFEILGVSINSDGVLFDKKVGRISWDYVGTRRYRTYFTLVAESDPSQYKAFMPLHDWNAGALYGVIQLILNIKFPKRKIPDPLTDPSAGS